MTRIFSSFLSLLLLLQFSLVGLEAPCSPFVSGHSCACEVTSEALRGCSSCSCQESPEEAEAVLQLAVRLASVQCVKVRQATPLELVLGEGPKAARRVPASSFEVKPRRAPRPPRFWLRGPPRLSGF